MTNCFIKNPYNLLPCKCHDENPGKTAIEIGPLWCGNLFEKEHIEDMKSTSTSLNLSSEVKSLINTLEVEAKCSSKESSEQQETVKSTGTDSVSGACGQKRLSYTTEEATTPKKPRLEDADLVSPHAKQLTEDPDLQPDVPYFYHNLHKKKVDKHLPKIYKLVQQLQRMGFRASRTHFETKAIRTDATLAELKLAIAQLAQKPR